MVDLRSLVVAALALLGGSAQAGYAYPADPPGFTRTGGTGFQGIGYAVNSANDQAFGRVVHQPNGLRVSVPGRPVTMPASYRFAANAPRVAAGIIFAHPALRTGAAIALWLGVGKLVWDEVDKVWKTTDAGTGIVASDGFEYVGYSGNKYPTKELACQSYIGDVDIASTVNAIPGSRLGLVHVGGGDMSCRVIRPNGNYSSSAYSTTAVPGGCPVGWYVTPAGCVQTPPPQTVDEAEFARRILNPDNQPGWPNVPAEWPMPERVPFELPPNTPLPVDDPFINPAPGPNPAHRPQFVPLGDPVPNPNYNPNAPPSPENQPYVQPGVRINPSPVPGKDPFRVDLQPTDRPKPDGTPMPQPENEGPGQTNPGDKPKPEEQQSLCEKHPDIVACQKLGEVTAKPLQKNTVTLAINREEGFGPANGSCPAPKEFMIMGKSMAFRWDLLCDFATGIRPILIGFAYLSAVLAFMGLTRRGD